MGRSVWRGVVEAEKRTDGVGSTEFEFQAKGLVHVNRICVEDLDVEEPLLEAFGGYEGDSWWEVAVDLRGKC